MTPDHLPHDIERRFFDGNGAALRCIHATLAAAQETRIATAYFEGSGFQALQDALRDKRIRLLVGFAGESRSRYQHSTTMLLKAAKSMAHPFADHSQGW